jgi:hypothetical protein
MDSASLRAGIKTSVLARKLVGTGRVDSYKPR